MTFALFHFTMLHWKLTLVHQCTLHKTTLQTDFSASLYTASYTGFYTLRILQRSCTSLTIVYRFMRDKPICTFVSLYICICICMFVSLYICICINVFVYLRICITVAPHSQLFTDAREISERERERAISCSCNTAFHCYTNIQI